MSAGEIWRRWTVGPTYVQARYGTARGFVRLAIADLDRRRGTFNVFEDVDWGVVRRLVFVCSGNICRSPYAEARTRAYGWQTASFALRGIGSLPADPAALTAAARRGIDLVPHRSTALKDFRALPGDLLLAMEPWQAWSLCTAFPACQVSLLGLWSRSRRAHLHDPHTLIAAYFDTCFSHIDSATEKLTRLSPGAAGGG